jgi:lipoprotein-releasing system permease protein
MLFKIPFELFIALRYLKSKRKEFFISVITIISLLGVAVSVTVLNVVLSVMTGFEEELQSKLIDTNAHITLKHVQKGLSNYGLYTEKIKNVPGVRDVYPYTYSQAMIRNEEGARGILVRGIANEGEPLAKLKKNLKDPATSDRLFSKAEVLIENSQNIKEKVSLPTIIIGEELRQRMGIFEGSIITLLSPELSSSPLGLIPRHRRFIVAASYSSGLVEYEAGLAYLSISEAQQFFGLGDTVTGIEIMVEDRGNTAATVKDISTLLQDSNDAFYISDWTEQNRPLWEAIKLEKRVYFIVLLLLILVASFSIVATLIMVVMEKGRDIAILKTMGAKENQILKVFLLQGSIIGFSGVILGSILAYFACLALDIFGFPIDARVFSLDKVPVHMHLSNFIVVACAGFFITSLAGLYPAIRASRIRPAEALRFE